jgi:hypothetical protein
MQTVASHCLTVGWRAFAARYLSMFRVYQCRYPRNVAFGKPRCRWKNSTLIVETGMWIMWTELIVDIRVWPCGLD